MELFNPTNYAWNPYALPPLLTGIFVLALGLVVLARNPRGVTHLVFLVWTATLAIWLLGFGIAYTAKDGDVAFAWHMVLGVGVLLIYPTAYSLAVLILDLAKKLERIALAYLVFFPFLVAHPFRLVIDGVHQFPWGYYPRAAVLAPFLIVAAILTLLATLLLYWRTYRNPTLPPRKREQARVLFGGFAVACLAITDWLPTFGISYYPLGFIPMLFWVGSVAYAILRYQLFAVTPQIAAPAIITSMADALLVADSEGKVVIANEAARVILGGRSLPAGRQGSRRDSSPASRDQNDASVVLLGKPLPSFLPQAQELWQKAQASPKHTTALVSGEESTLKAPSGSDIPISLSVAVVRDPSGHPIGIAAVGHDLRKTKEFITQLEAQKKSLEEANKKLAERTEEAERLNKLAVGRELKMIELKSRIRELEGKVGKS